MDNVLGVRVRVKGWDLGFSISRLGYIDSWKVGVDN
jgi:hypothetical protein